MLPEKSDAYLYAQDLFYTSTNDVSFFVEDTDQEELYFAILSRILGDINFDRVFPLNGKENVINHAILNQGNRKSVYIVDKDYDDILGKKTTIDNLFYLERYSIENYLIEKEAIIKYIVSKDPTVNRNIVSSILRYESENDRILNEIGKLVPIFIMNQRELNQRLKSTSLSIDVFFERKKEHISSAILSQYISEVRLKLETEGRNLQMEKELEAIAEQLRLKDIANLINNCPGKYICSYWIRIIKRKFTYTSTTTTNQFVYYLACECSFKSMSSIADKIKKYINPN